MRRRIPKIAVTYVDGERERTKLIAGHTDVEDLDSDIETSGRSLSIGAPLGVIDNELFEASDDEESPDERPKTPLPYSFPDYGGYLEEVSKVHDDKQGVVKGKSKLTEKGIFLGLEREMAGTTDLEDFEGSNEEYEEDPEDFDLEDFSDDRIVICDGFKGVAGRQYHTPVPSPTDESGSERGARKSFLKTDITDAEEISDTGNTLSVCRMGKKRKSKWYERTCHSPVSQLLDAMTAAGMECNYVSATTDVEELSGTESAKCKMYRGRKERKKKCSEDIPKTISDGSQGCKKKSKLKPEKLVVKTDVSGNLTEAEDLSEEVANKVEKKNIAEVTDTEDLTDFDEPRCMEEKELKLPKPLRRLILISETVSGRNTSIILPLDDFVFKGLKADDDRGKTDVEDVDAPEEDIRTPCRTPELPDHDYGKIEDKEVDKSLKKKKPKRFDDLFDPVTDSEELQLTEKQVRRRTRKVATRITDGHLAVADTTSAHTDVEELQSDIEEIKALKAPTSSSGAVTDFEDVDVSSADEISVESNPPEMPHITVEETTPTASIRRKTFYAENFLKKPEVDNDIHTDVDDEPASTDDNTDSSDEDILSTLNEASETFVYISNDRKVNWDDPSEDVHKKEFRQQIDLHTDVEDIGDEIAVANYQPARNRGFARRRKRREGTEKGQKEKFVRETQGIRSAITEDSDLISSKENVADDAKRESEKLEIVDGSEIGRTKVERSQDFPGESSADSYVTSPTFRRKYHSQRIGNRKLPVIIPYQGDYDETYVSDEDGEYTVQEPEDFVRKEFPASFQSSPDIFDPEFIYQRRSRAFSQATLAGARSPSSPTAQESETGEVHASNGHSPVSVAQVEDTVVPKEHKPLSAEFSHTQHVITSAGIASVKSPETESDDIEKGKAKLPEKEAQTKEEISKVKKDKSVDGAEESPVNESPSSKPRVIFYLESEEEAASDSDAQNTLDSTYSSEVIIDKAREELSKALHRDQLILDDRLLGIRSGVFDDLSDESLTRTKELVDERLRKISETKSIDEAMLKKEKSPASSEIKEQFKIGRFHVTTSLDSTLDVDSERKIAEKLKTDRQADDVREEMERELPERLSDEGFAEVLKEISKTGMQLPLDDMKKEEKKERTLKRVERRFERMASETLEKEMEEENVSEEKLNEKREVEFQKMLSQLSTEEVAECQQEYLQLWDDGGLSSFTPTDDWESRDMDTPENELDEDSPKKPESSRGLRGSGKNEEPGKSPSDARKSSKFPEASAEIQKSPPEPVRISDEISPVTHSLGITHPLHVGSSPSEIQEDENLSYEDRKKFWEGMTTSQSSESESELRRSFHDSVTVKRKVETESVKRTEKVRTPEDGGLVKSLTGIYSEKIAAGEIVMPAMPRPKSGNLRDLIANDDAKEDQTIVATYLKKDISPDAPGVSELEAELKKRRSFIDESAVSETIEVREVVHETMVTRQLTQESSVDSEKEFLSKYGEESVAFDNSAFREDDEFDLQGGKKDLEEKFHKRPPPVSLRKTIYERSMSLPAEDIDEGVSVLKTKKRSFEAQVKKEIIVEQLMTQPEEEFSAEHKSLKEYSIKQSEAIEDNIAKKVTEVARETVQTVTISDVKDTAADVVDDLLKKGVIYIDQRTVVTQIGKFIQKGDAIGSEGKEKEGSKVEDEAVPSITVTLSGKKQAETASLGESEDTQSESDVTPEDARVVDNGEAPWDGSGTQSGGTSPNDDFDVGRDIREPGIGRWIGQEDLSQQLWEKEDIDSSHFKMETKWQRTRSESPSPKEPFVCTPEEHYPDTVWEVPVQEHLESEEITEDIPIEKQVIIEKDEEEEEEEEEEEVEKPSKESKITEVEAREIAEEVLEYIEFEVENRASILMTDIDDIQEPRNQVTEYLRQLAGEKNLDDDEIQLIQSVLAQKHRDQVKKLQEREVIGSSQEITDEDLRSNEPETDSSPMESQSDKIRTKDKPKDDGLEKNLRDVEIVDRTIAEVKESLEAAQEELIEQRKKRQKEEILKKESPSEFEFKGINIDKKYEHGFESTEWRTSKDYETIDEEGDRILEKVEISMRSDFHKEGIEHDRTEESTKITGTDVKTMKIDESMKKETERKRLTETEIVAKRSDKITKDTMSSIDVAERKMTEKEEIAKEVTERSDNLERTEKQSSLKSKDEREEVETLRTEFAMESKDEKFRDVKEDKKERSLMEEREDSSSESETRSGGRTEKRFTTHTAMKMCESVTTAFKSQSSEEKLKELEIPPEGVIFKKIDIHKYSSEDSPRSTSQEEAVKSGGEEGLSSSPSLDKQIDASKDIKMRRTTGGLLVKGDRRSGTDLEPYSSSGESHYQSCELMTSRPCSSDVEALIAGVGGTGSSEYESALSHELSSRQTTSGEYHTAVSSLSSRESIKSLDSESSGHLASIEISSDASETLIPSAMELDKDLEMSGAILLDDDSPEMMEERRSGRPPVYLTQKSAPALGRSVDEDFEIISESEFVTWTGEVSEDDGTDAATIATEDMVVDGEDRPQKMKRSHEMTFQPEPRPIVIGASADTPSEQVVDKFGSSVDESIVSNQDERFGSSLEETGSILSMSLSTASETSAIRTVIEQHQTDSERMDASLTLSATSVDSGSREELEKLPLTQEISTSTVVSSLGRKTASVTITTSTANDQGIPSVSTQVTSVSRKSSMVDDAKSDSESSGSKGARRNDSLSQANGPTQVEYVPEYDEIETIKSKKTQGHRRKESTSSFVPTMKWSVTDSRTLKRDSREEDSSEESEKYAGMLTEKEVKNDEKKEADDSEKLEESYETQLLIDSRSGIAKGTEEDFRESDGSRPHSQMGKIDLESSGRLGSSILGEDQPDSELSELMKQGSSETEREDPIERPLSPEPDEFENKDDTPEFSSEAQASVTELEMEYSGAYSRRDEYASHVSPIREEKFGMQYPDLDMDKYEQEKIPEGEFVFSDIPRQVPGDGFMESMVAEKHESETREKEITKKGKDQSSPGDIPDITVTEHMTPLLDRGFHYPDMENEERERKTTQSTTPDTSASSRASSSTSTDQGREYVLEDVTSDRVIKEDSDMEDKQTEMSMSVTDRTVLERSVIREEDEEASDSPNSDSFEILDKPDITDEYVIIEEVGREACETDQEGRALKIESRKRKVVKKKSEEKEELIPSPPAPATKMTDLKYFPGDEDTGPFQFDSDSPPVAGAKPTDGLKKKNSREEESDIDVDPQLEEHKKWMEMQFQVEEAAKIIEYPYEMAFERAPLEDIKEEELGEFDSSSKIGSMGSQKESIGSFGSVKDSFSSTPDYDILAGRKYFTRSGEHDDVSMSSLQEFELIEKKILLENCKKSGSSSSQDSLSSKKLGTSSKSGQGDDVSIGSLKEFENLEKACVTVVKMERKAKEEEAILSEIDEGHESQISESESCETVSGAVRERAESETEDFDKKMFEIDEIIRQAQTNVEKFADLTAFDKTESVGRGDSLEEVARVPDLELDAPLYGKSLYEQPKAGEKSSHVGYSTQVVTRKKVQQWRESEEQLKHGEGSLKHKLADEISEGSELLEPKSKIKSVSSDSLETRTSERFDTISMDSFDMQLDKLRTKTESIGDGSDFGDKKISDFLDEEDGRYQDRGRESSSSGRDGDYSSSGREDSEQHKPSARADPMLGSTDSLDPSSSTATHATYHYETDSVMSSSFTSGGSNTLVSSMDNLDLVAGAGIEDFGAGKAGVWFENISVPGTEAFVSEIIEPLDDGTFSHIIHRRTDMVPDATKVIFRGEEAEKSLQSYLESLPPEEHIEETRETDEHGNIHIRKVVKRRVILRSGEEKPATRVSIETLRTGLTHPIVSETSDPHFEEGFSHTIHRRVEMPPDVKKIVFSEPDADRAMEEYMQGFDPGEQVEETEEVDEHGNVHVKRVLQRRMVMTSDEARGMTGSEIADYFKHFEGETWGSGHEHFQGGEPFADGSRDPKYSLGHPITRAHIQDLRLTGKEDDEEDMSTRGTARGESEKEIPAAQKESGMTRRAPLLSDISMDDEAEYDTTEHDWRYQLEILNAEADEGEIDQQLDKALETSYTSQSKR